MVSYRRDQVCVTPLTWPPLLPPGAGLTSPLAPISLFGGEGASSCPLTAAQLEGTPEILPSGAQVLVPNEAANEAILKEFRR